MAEQPQLPDDITPSQFFEQLLPMGFQAQSAEGGAPPSEFAIQFTLTGDGGGAWHAFIHDNHMHVAPGTKDANLSVTLSTDDWRDAVLNRNGASLGIILPANRPGKPDNSGRAKALKGTMALELARAEKDPFKVELCFNGAAGAADAAAHGDRRLRRHAGRQPERSDAVHAGEDQGRGRHGLPMQIASLNM